MYKRDVSHSDTDLSLKKESAHKRSASASSEQSIITIRSRKSSAGRYDLPNYVSFRSKSSLSLHLLDICSQDFSSLSKTLVPSVSYMNIDGMSEFINYWVDPIFKLYFLLHLSNIEYESIFVYFFN
jgi:hypothetical protein